MNICLVSQEYPPETAHGGIGTQTWNKARTLAKLGHTVHVLSCNPNAGPELETENDPGVVVHRMQPPGLEFPVYDMATYWVAYSWSVLCQLSRLMRRNTFDLIDFADYAAEGFAYQLDRTLWNWVPVVVQLHGPLAMFAEHVGWPDKNSEFYQVGTFVEGFSIKRADSLMACSANIADFTANFYGIPREEIAVVYCGVDTDVFRPRYERSEVKDRPTVLFVGHITASKGVETVFEAVLRIRSRYPNIRLQIVGGTDNDAERNIVKQFSLRGEKVAAQGMLEIPGFVTRDRLPEFYRQADVFCSPAYHEMGVANVYLEAMACGCPVVASITGAAPEAVIDGETGLLVQPNDVGATARALDQILSNKSLRLRMGEACRRRIEENFTMDRYITRVLALYQKAIESSRQKLYQLKAGMKS